MKRLTLFLLLIPSLSFANGEVYSPNMALPVPTVGVTTGPSYASDINASLGIIDSHDHSPGNGVQITPAGLNINSNLSFLSNNAISVRSVRFAPQVSCINGAADVGAVYECGVDLYYNDGSGNQVRITQSGGVAGSPGSIANLTSPASASFVSANATFVWQSGSSVAGNMDAATYIIRYPGSYPTPSGNYIALQAPSSLATGFALTFPPTLPGTTGFWMTSDTAGALSWSGVDNSTLQYAANVVSIKNSGVNTVQLADGSVTQAKRAALGQQLSSSSASFSTGSTALTAVTNLTVTITTTGRPVWIGLIPDATTNAASVIQVNGSFGGGSLAFFRGTTDVALIGLGAASSTSESASSFNTVDIVGAGTYTYTVKVNNLNGTTFVSNAKLIAFEE